MDTYKISELRTAIDGFYKSFQVSKSDFETLIHEEKEEVNSEIKRCKLDLASEKLAAIRDDFKKALVYLPAYDQKSYQEGIKDLENVYSLESQRLQPVAKFSFKKRGLLGKPTDATILPKSPKDYSADTNIDFQKPSGSFKSKNDSIRITNHKSKVIELESLLDGVDSSISISVHLSNLDGCVINLFSTQQTLAIIYLDDLVDCVVFSPPISNSVLIKNCKNCIFFLACHQFRMHNTYDTRILLHAASNPIIEDCHDIAFGPYNIQHSQLKELSKKESLLLETPNKYNLVEDFNWLKQSTSPNWSILAESSQNRLSNINVENFLADFKQSPLPNHAVTKLF